MESDSISETSHSIVDIDIPNTQNFIQEYNELSSKVDKIHASFLFYRDKISSERVPQLCQKIYTNLVKRIGGTDESLFLSGWKDLGFHLGVTGEEINYIENSIKTCPTDVVLKVFCQNDDATMDKIIQALLSLNRLDVIEGIFEPLHDLLNALIKNYEPETDQGYHSDASKNNTGQIIKPSFFRSNLPEVLRQRDNKDPKNDFDSELSISMPTINKPSVLLTYYEDGLSVVEKIKSILRVNNIHIVSLEDEKSHAILNPEHFIRHYFEEVDYVIPVLTEGYMSMITSPASICASSLDNFDCTYARFIYTLMSSHYINGTGCLNKKVRSVLPHNVDKKLIAELYKYPILNVWIREEQLNKLINTLF